MCLDLKHSKQIIQNIFEKKNFGYSFVLGFFVVVVVVVVAFIRSIW